MMRLCLAVLVLSFTSCVCGRIDPGHVGVVVPLGGDDKGDLSVIGTGRYFYGINTSVTEFPVYNQQHIWTNAENEGKVGVDERLYFADRDGLRLGADVGIQFHVPQESVLVLFKKYRQDLDHVRDTILKMSVRNAMNLTAQRYTAEQMFGDKRGAFFDEVLLKVKSEMTPNGLEVDNLYLNGELELPKQIRETIQAKLQATMTAQQKENEKRSVEAEMAKQVAQAHGEAQATYEKAEGGARARVAQAEGEAAAQLAAAKGRADARILEADAEAKANQKLSASMTPQIFELKKMQLTADVQKAYAEKWQGTVPTTILPAQANGFMMDMRGFNSSAGTVATSH